MKGILVFAAVSVAFTLAATATAARPSSKAVAASCASMYGYGPACVCIDRAAQWDLARYTPDVLAQIRPESWKPQELVDQIFLWERTLPQGHGPLGRCVQMVNQGKFNSQPTTSVSSGQPSATH